MSENETTEQEAMTAADSYPDWADDDEQRRAFVLEAIGSAASEMDAPTLSQMVIELAELLRTGSPTMKRKPRPIA
jgi:hypothetical protein